MMNDEKANSRMFVKVGGNEADVEKNISSLEDDMNYLFINKPQLQRKRKKVDEGELMNQKPKRIGKFYKCTYPECEMIFNKLCIMRDHIRTHNGYKPWKCTFAGCNKSFAQAGNLKIHEKSHNQELIFLCDFPGCNKKFTARSYVKIHEKTHYGVKLFKCRFEACTKSFYDRGNLKYHQKKVHSEQLEEFPHTCIHSNCNLRFKTEKEKIRHHYTYDSECMNETMDLLYLLAKFKHTFLNLKFDDRPSENAEIVKELEIDYKQTLEKIKDKENFEVKVGTDFYKLP